MTVFVFKINTDNAAFGENANAVEYGEEVARLLVYAAKKVQEGYSCFPLKDSNGSTVGTAGIQTE